MMNCFCVFNEHYGLYELFFFCVHVFFFNMEYIVN